MQRLLSQILLFLLLVVAIRGPAARGEPAVAIDLGQIAETQNISAKARVYRDTNDRSLEELLSVIDAEGVPVPDILSGGYRNGFYWVKIAFVNNTDKTQDVHLLLKNRLTSYLEFFIPNPKENAAVTIQRLRAAMPTLEITVAPQSSVNMYLKLKFGLQDSLTLNLVPSPRFEAEVTRSTMKAQEIMFGVILGLLIFNAALWVFTRESVFILHAASAVLAFAVIFMASGLVYYYFREDTWNRFLPVAGSFAVASFNAFGMVHLRLENSHPIVHRLLTIGMVNGVIGGILLTFGLDKHIIYFTDVNLLMLISMAGVLIYRFPPTRYRNMRFYVIGWVALGVSGVSWLGSEYGLLAKNVYTESSFTFGLAMEILIVSLGLADQINHLKNELSNYNKNLEKIVDEKTRDIRSIMEYIPIGICMITSKNLIHRDFSKKFREFFPSANLEQSAASELLFEHADCSTDDKSQAISALSAALGEDILNFETNAHTLPAEITWTDPARKSHIMDLTWNAMEDSRGTVDRILVTMRDVSDLRKLQARSREQEEELSIIKEILDVPPVKFQRFMRTAREALADTASHIRSEDPEVLHHLFRTMHTLKGIARSLYFKNIASLLHDLEQAYADMLKKPHAQWNIASMLIELTALDNVLTRYEKIAQEKLNRSLEQNRSIELPLSYAQHIYRRLNELMDQRGVDSRFLEEIATLRSELQSRVFRSAAEVFTELCSSLPSLAKDLHKPAPNVQLDVAGFALDEQTEELVRSIFVHLLRNSMDHGIESAAERASQGKPETGTISIQMRTAGDAVILKIHDDGRGLPMKKIQEKGHQLGLVAPTANQNAIAELIFDAGFSTADQITEISGRGVGLNAIRQFVTAAGGTIRILLNARNESEYQSFSFEITWPQQLFERQPLPTLHDVA